MLANAGFSHSPDLMMNEDAQQTMKICLLPPTKNFSFQTKLNLLAGVNVKWLTTTEAPVLVAEQV